MVGGKGEGPMGGCPWWPGNRVWGKKGILAAVVNHD